MRRNFGKLGWFGCNCTGKQHDSCWTSWYLWLKYNLKQWLDTYEDGSILLVQQLGAWFWSIPRIGLPKKSKIITPNLWYYEIYLFIRFISIFMYNFNRGKYINIRTARKSSRFHHFLRSVFLFICWNLGVCHMSTIIVVSFGTAFLLGFIKNLCFIAGELKCMLNTLKKHYVFGWFCISPQRQHFFSLQTNLRTVLAVMSQTSAFLWMYHHS